MSIRRTNIDRVNEARKSAIPTIGRGEPINSQGSEGDIAFRRTGSGLKLYIKANQQWHGVKVGESFKSLEEKINAFVHGPLAFDNAVSEEAAKIKGINNDVAGDADVLLVPNLETGNSLSKIMVYFMNACAAGIVIGGKVPVVVPSRADSKNSKLASIMAAVVAANN